MSTNITQFNSISDFFFFDTVMFGFVTYSKAALIQLWKALQNENKKATNNSDLKDPRIQGLWLTSWLSKTISNEVMLENNHWMWVHHLRNPNHSITFQLSPLPFIYAYKTKRNASQEEPLIKRGSRNND